MNVTTHAADALADEVLRAARRPSAARALLLDLDGTLAPIAPRPELARVPTGTLAALERLTSAGWTVAVVSGRPAREVRAMVPARGVAAFGSHGVEGGPRPRRGPALPASSRRRLARLARAAKPLARGTSGALVEVKPAGIAFHERMVAREDLAAWRRRVGGFLASADLAGFEVLQGRMVVEIRPHGWSKGDVLEIVAPRRRTGRPDASLVAIGDDRTDEDLFRAVLGRGLAVRVGAAVRPSLATRSLASPASVGRFLERLAADAERRRTA